MSRRRLGIERSRRRAGERSPARRATPREIPAHNLAHGVIVGSTIAHGTHHGDRHERRAERAGRARGAHAVQRTAVTERRRGRLPPPSGRRVSRAPRPRRPLQRPADRARRSRIARARDRGRGARARRLPRAGGRRRLRTALAGATPYPDKILGISEPASRRGDVDAGLAAADVRIEAEYTTPIETHNPMEPHATVARWRRRRADAARLDAVRLRRAAASSRRRSASRRASARRLRLHRRRVRLEGIGMVARRPCGDRRARVGPAREGRARPAADVRPGRRAAIHARNA